MKKLLIVSQYFWPEEFRINELATELCEENLEIKVLTQIPSYPSAKIFKGRRYRFKEQFKKITIYRIPTLSRGNSKIAIFFNYLSYILFSLPSLLYLKSKKFDFLIVFQPSPVTVGLWPAIIFNSKKIKKIIWILDLWPDTFYSVLNSKIKFLDGLVNSLSKFIYQRYDNLLVQTNGFKKRLKEMQIEESYIKYFPNFSEEVFSKALSKKSSIKCRVDEIFSTIPDGFNILFAGNLGFSQDIFSVLKAAELTLNKGKINWIFLGAGRAENPLKEYLNKRDLDNVYFLGRYNIELMPYFFNKADTMLVSLSDEEVFSMTIPGKIPSYMACSKPILGMLNGEGKDLIEKSNCGLCSHAGDFRSLAKNASLMANLKSDELDIYSNNSLKFYNEHLSKKHAVKIIKDLFEDE